LAQLALMALERADWEQGVALAAGAVDAAGPEPGPGCALVHAVAAFARSNRGRVHESRIAARAATRMLAAREDTAPWYGAQARIALARAELRLSNAADAR